MDREIKLQSEVMNGFESDEMKAAQGQLEWDMGSECDSKR